MEIGTCCSVMWICEQFFINSILIYSKLLAYQGACVISYDCSESKWNNLSMKIFGSVFWGDDPKFLLLHFFLTCIPGEWSGWDTSLNGSDTSLKLITWDGEHSVIAGISCMCLVLIQVYLLGLSEEASKPGETTEAVCTLDSGWDLESGFLGPTSVLSLAGCAVL